jgi:hypothetical protein
MSADLFGARDVVEPGVIPGLGARADRDHGVRTGLPSRNLRIRLRLGQPGHPAPANPGPAPAPSPTEHPMLRSMELK